MAKIWNGGNGAPSSNQAWTVEQLDKVIEFMKTHEYSFHVGPGFVQVTIKNTVIAELNPPVFVMPLEHFVKVAAAALFDPHTRISQVGPSVVEKG